MLLIIVFCLLFASNSCSLCSHAIVHSGWNIAKVSYVFLKGLKKKKRLGTFVHFLVLDTFWNIIFFFSLLNKKVVLSHLICLKNVTLMFVFYYKISVRRLFNQSWHYCFLFFFFNWRYLTGDTLIFYQHHNWKKCDFWDGEY